MKLSQVLAQRRMVRAFSTRTLDDGQIESLCDRARHAPSAGHTQAVSFLLLDNSSTVARYWDTTLPVDRRSTFSFPQLLDTPALVLVLVSPRAYLDRYSEADKTKTGRGTSINAWPVPFWWVDSGAVIQNLLLLISESGLGACIVGLFEHEDDVKAEFGLEDDQRIVATIAVGHPLASPQGRSAGRPWKPLHDIVRRPD